MNLFNYNKQTNKQNTVTPYERCDLLEVEEFKYLDGNERVTGGLVHFLQ